MRLTTASGRRGSTAAVSVFRWTHACFISQIHRRDSLCSVSRFSRRSLV